MNEKEKIEYINGFLVWQSLYNKTKLYFNNKKFADDMQEIRVKIEEKFNKYSEDLYLKYLKELEDTYQDNPEILLEIMMNELDESAGRFILFSKLTQKIEKREQKEKNK